ncbi:MAG: DUF3021 domain-containing protein [Defluviitaleaceae bacterium]|nr:DUF3021 domain-containing protein [Defluviitaleaceae bacterium]
MFKLIKKYLLEGIGWGCFILVVNIIYLNLTSPETTYQVIESFPTTALSTILSVMGIVSTLIVYEIERLHIGLKLIIHSILAIGILLIVGFSFNMDYTQNLRDILINIFSNMLILLIIWTAYYMKEKREIKQINEKLLEKSLEIKSDTE